MARAVRVTSVKQVTCDICVRTVTFHALVYQPVEEGATVVTEGRAGVSVDLKLVFTSRILQRQKNRGERRNEWLSDPG